MTGGVHPYCAEYAKSGRSKCRGCNSLIEYKLLRLGICLQLSYWFHSDCFFKRHKPGSTNDILNFNKLKPDDKAYICAKIRTDQVNNENKDLMDKAVQGGNQQANDDKIIKNTGKSGPVKGKKGEKYSKDSSQDGRNQEDEKDDIEKSSADIQVKKQKRAKKAVNEEILETDFEESSKDEDKDNSQKTKVSAGKPARRTIKIVGDESKFMIDYSLSDRATCCSCKEKIAKSIVRIARMDYTSNKGKALNGIPRWYHVECFARNREFFEFWDGADSLPGFFALKAEDQIELGTLLPELTTEMMIAQGASQWKIQKIASHSFRKIQNVLTALTVKDYERILKHNKQEIPSKCKKSELLDLVVSAAKKGVVVTCPECKTKGYVKKTVTNLYKCFNMNDGKTCTFESLNPPRTALQIPKTLRDEFDILNSYKFTVQERAPQAEVKVPSGGLNINAPEFFPRPKTTVPKGPLSGLEFAVIGVPHVKERIKQLGGHVVTFINSRTKAVITNKESIKAFQEKNKKRFNYIEQFYTPIVGEDFLNCVGRGRMKDLLRDHDMTNEWVYELGDSFFNEKYGPWGRNWW